MDDETIQLRNYTVAKQQVAASVRALKQFLEARHDSDSVDQAQELLVKLAEDRFNLAVVGQFKRGKSSLMNAIIGRDLLPTGLLPLTSAITTLCYGPQERAVLQRRGWSLEQEISLNELPDYITEHSNPGNEKGLVEARVELPVRFLRRGLYFIDTSGVGSARQENTATTYGFLPEVDAVIFVTSVEAPLSETEQGFLHDLRDQVRMLFIVVNKIDLLTEHERDSVLSYIRTEVETTLATNDIRIYPVSARQALAAKLSQDTDKLQQSGLIKFDEALTTFLANQQGQTFLVAVLDRALNLIAGISKSERSPADAESQGTTAKPSLDTIREALEALRSGFLTNQAFASLPVVSSFLSTNDPPVKSAPATVPIQKPITNLRMRTCPICAAQTQVIFDFFAERQYQLGKDELAQRAFIGEHGFCPMHTWQFQQIASPQGMSEGYAPLLETVTAELRQTQGHPEQAAARIASLLSSSETCSACHVIRESETAQIRQFIEKLTSSDGRVLYLRSERLCLPHLHAVLTTTSDTELIVFLLHEQVQYLEEIAEDMRAYTLKRDSLRSGLVNAREKNAWRRTLVQLVGEPTARSDDERRHTAATMQPPMQGDTT